MTSTRSKVDEDVERAFFLLHHYESLLKPSRHGPDPDLENARNQLELVIRKWMPPELVANDRLLGDVVAAIGDRTAVANLLSGANLMKVRIACLERVVAEDIRTRLMSQTPAVACKDEIQHWRALLPTVRRKPDGTRFVDRADVQAAKSRVLFWSMDLTSFPSWRGASYSLAAACEALARWAQTERKSTTDRLRPLFLLVHRLREHPDWRLVDPHDIARVVVEQVELVRGVEQLLVEMDLALPSTQPTIAAVAADVDANVDAAVPEARQPTRKHEQPRQHQKAKTGTASTSTAPDVTDLKLLSELNRSYPYDVRFGDIKVPGLSVPSTRRRRLDRLRELLLVSSPRKGRWRIEQAGRSRIAQ